MSALFIIHFASLSALNVDMGKRDCLFGVVKALGRWIKINDPSLKLECDRFVRICVEIDLSFSTPINW